MQTKLKCIKRIILKSQGLLSGILNSLDYCNKIKFSCYLDFAISKYFLRNIYKVWKKMCLAD